MIEQITKRIVTTETDWAEKRDSVLSYDHPGCDWLFVQIDSPNAEYGISFEVYNVDELNKGNTTPTYIGEEFPEAISIMF